MTKFRTAYGQSERVQTRVSGLTLTKQSFKRECDINHIISKYQQTGLIEHVSRYQGQYADLTDYPDYQESMNKVIDANNAFMSLPSSLRKRFSNDPAEFLHFVSDPANANELIALGLAKLPATGDHPKGDVGGKAAAQGGDPPPADSPVSA